MVQRPRGTRDLLPEEMERRRGLESLLRRVAARWGYREVQTPTFEELALFTGRSGPGIVRSLYVFQDKDGRDLCLRPELTAPAVRLYLAEMSRAPKPLRLFYFGPCYRYEEPQKNRYREFWQFGVEVIGAPLREAEAEVLGLAGAILREARVEGAEVRLGHVGFLKHYLKELGDEARARVLRALDKKEFRLAAQEWDKAMELEGAKSFADVEKLLGPNPFRNEVEDLRRSLEPYGVRYQEVPSIVRGLDYYTGPVFEVHVPRLGAQSQVCGGGSYRLEVGGREVESTGFAFGFDRLLEAADLPRPGGVRVAVCATPAARKEALRLAGRLRERVAAEVDLMGRSLKEQLAHAAATGATHAAILGERETEAGTLTLKEMRSGRQRTVTLDEALRALEEAERGGS